MSVDGLIVRSGGAADLAGVVALERAAVEAPHWGEAEYVGIVGSQEDRFGETQGSGVRRCLLVAEVGGRLAGFSVGKVIGAGRDCVGELESVVVDGEARRGGVGTALCGSTVDWCRGEGAVAMELEVRAGSVGAIALYTGLGFVTVGRRRDYYHAAYKLGIDDEGPAEDALLMRLELAEGK